LFLGGIFKCGNGDITVNFAALLFGTTPYFKSNFAMQAEHIKALIESKIPECDVKSVEVQGDHIGLVIVSPAFAGLTPVKKQQLVLSTLSEQFADRSIHAVDYIKSFTPEQWLQQQQQQ